MLRRRNQAVRSDMRYASIGARRNRAAHVQRTKHVTVWWLEDEELVSLSCPTGRLANTPYCIAVHSNSSQRTAHIRTVVAIINSHRKIGDLEIRTERYIKRAVNNSGSAA